MNGLSKKTKNLRNVFAGAVLMALSQYAFSGMALSETAGIFSVWSFLVASAAFYTMVCIFLTYGVGFRHPDHFISSKKKIKVGLMFFVMLCLSRFVMDDVFTDARQLPTVHGALVYNASTTHISATV